MPHDTTTLLRRALLWLVALGLTGVTADLLLLEHYESVSQMAPLVATALAAGCLIWHVVSGTATTLRAFQAAMVLILATGLVGIVLHYRGNMEFQLDIDPTQSSWSLFTHVLRAKAPPALAPAAMAQLGLLGLVYAWRHPAASSSKYTSRGERT